MNEAWDVALDCVIAGDLEGFTNALGDNEDDLVNWDEGYLWMEFSYTCVAGWGCVFYIHNTIVIYLAHPCCENEELEER